MALCNAPGAGPIYACDRETGANLPRGLDWPSLLGQLLRAVDRLLPLANGAGSMGACRRLDPHTVAVRLPGSPG
jgi:hypothetical protein